MAMNYLESVRKQFEYYKQLGEKTLAQLDEEEIFRQYNSESNSIAIIIRHLHGNMLSRWTDFMTTDGEKPWRTRELEFVSPDSGIDTVMSMWQEGWQCLFSALDGLNEEDLSAIVYIRNDGHTVMDAINRQLAHYPYHIGQIVYLGKMWKDTAWQSLSIPRGGTDAFNAQKFNREKGERHFTDDFIDHKK